MLKPDEYYLELITAAQNNFFYILQEEENDPGQLETALYYGISKYLKSNFIDIRPVSETKFLFIFSETGYSGSLLCPVIAYRFDEFCNTFSGAENEAVDFLYALNDAVAKWDIPGTFLSLQHGIIDTL